jgi:hypothetical protein
MGTLKGFPNPPALWLRWAKPTFANAVMGTVEDWTVEDWTVEDWIVENWTVENWTVENWTVEN